MVAIERLSWYVSMNRQRLRDYADQFPSERPVRSEHDYDAQSLRGFSGECGRGLLALGSGPPVAEYSAGSRGGGLGAICNVKDAAPDVSRGWGYASAQASRAHTAEMGAAVAGV
jgi:hypothetical protein